MIRNLIARTDPKAIARQTLSLLVGAALIASFAANICAYFDVEWFIGGMIGFAILFGAVLPLLDIATGPEDGTDRAPGVPDVE